MPDKSLVSGRADYGNGEQYGVVSYADHLNFNENQVMIEDYDPSMLFNCIYSINWDEIVKFQKSFLKNVESMGYERREEYGHSILHKECKEVDLSYLGAEGEMNDKVRSFVMDRMFPYVATGGGLAANQIGMGAKIYAMHCPGGQGGIDSQTAAFYTNLLSNSTSKGLNSKERRLQDFIDDGYVVHTEEPMFLINPVILENTDDCVLEWVEGCLSLNGFRIKKNRPAGSIVRYYDLDGNEKTVKVFGWLAECAQHEGGHLDGVLMTDDIPVHKLAQFVSEYRIKH